MAEVKRRKLDGILEPVMLYYADTLYDMKRVSITAHGWFGAASAVTDNCTMFESWNDSEKKKLGLENLYNKCFPGQTYNGKYVHNCNKC